MAKHLCLGISFCICKSTEFPPATEGIHTEAEFMNYDSVEVFGYNLEVSVRGNGFLSGFPPFSFTVYINCSVETVRDCVSLKSQRAVEGTVNSKDFIQEFGFRCLLLVYNLLYFLCGDMQ
jgi:hypothetical protein